MIETSLIPALRGNAGVIAAVSQHNGRPSVDIGTRPDGADMPGVTLQRAGLDRLYSQEGPVGLTGFRIQVDGWGKTAATARAAFDAVRRVLETGGNGWRAFWLTDTDSDPNDLDGGVRVFRASGDFMIWTEET